MAVSKAVQVAPKNLPQARLKNQSPQRLRVRGLLRTEALLRKKRLKPVRATPRAEAELSHHEKCSHAAAQKIRHAVIGQGYISQIAVLPTFAHASKNSELAALISDELPNSKNSIIFNVPITGTYDDYDALLRSGKIDAVYIALPNHMHCGTKGSLRVNSAYEMVGDQKYTLTIDGKSREHSFPKRDQFAPELVYFSDCILTDRMPEPSGREVSSDVQIIMALYKSAQTDRPMRIKGLAQDAGQKRNNRYVARRSKNPS